MEGLFTLPRIVNYQVITIVEVITIVRFHMTTSGIPMTSIPALATKLTDSK